ncbi:MAG TPA: hypothetical protein PK079_09485 [Leptospiraceae bacterium]|nr:hypothetical protein [Leptospiraceae bacterium]HMW04537.1 hypothetical protein [Leptospiraceae bacterium]HMX34334.1 hypothetical protein [Leptospiraceae bacterium]HMY30723.1 hypothetical protein [Leptospiraceae bacterium]HMZ64301.1 hypothetical protein [Leptospiraceae bacterium]
MKIFFITLFILLISLTQCSAKQTKQTKAEKIRVFVTIDQSSSENKKFLEVIKSSIISSISLTDSHKFLDEEYEQYYLLHTLEIAQSIGDRELETFLNDMINLRNQETFNGIHIIINTQKLNTSTDLHLKFIAANGKHSELILPINKTSLEFYNSLQEKIILTLEPDNEKAIETLRASFILINDIEAYNFYLQGKSEKRSKTIYGYLNAIKLFSEGLKKDPINILLLNEMVQTMNLIISNLNEIISKKEIINKKEIIAEARSEVNRNIMIIQTLFENFNLYAKNNPDQYQKILEYYNQSPLKKEFDFKIKNFRNELDTLLVKWQNERFGLTEVKTRDLKNLESSYAPLIANDFFQTITNSRISINDIIRALIKYSHEHPENHYYIHYFKNFSQLMSLLNKIDYIKINPDASISYQLLRQEYIEYIRKYLSIIKKG